MPTVEKFQSDVELEVIKTGNKKRSILLIFVKATLNRALSRYNGVLVCYVSFSVWLTLNCFNQERMCRVPTVSGYPNSSVVPVVTGMECSVEPSRQSWKLTHSNFFVVGNE